MRPRAVWAALLLGFVVPTPVKANKARHGMWSANGTGV
jgi:hypothetical protein